MKKFFITTSIVLTAGLLFALPVFALDLGSDILREAGSVAGYDPNTTQTTFAQNVGIIVRAILSLVGVIFTALIVYAGIMWMTAHGEEDKIKKAQDILKASIIGLVITLSAYSISAFIVPRLLERTTSNPTVDNSN